MAYPLCTDCRWIVPPVEEYLDEECSCPHQPMSVVDGRPRWKDCHIQRHEGEGEDNIHHPDLCGKEGRYFEAAEGSDHGLTEDAKNRNATIQECRDAIFAMPKNNQHDKELLLEATFVLDDLKTKVPDAV